MDLLEELLKEAAKPMGAGAIKSLAAKLLKDRQKAKKKEMKLRDTWATAYMEHVILEAYEYYIDQLDESGKEPSAKDAKEFISWQLDVWTDTLSAHDKVTDLVGGINPKKLIDKIVKIK